MVARSIRRSFASDQAAAVVEKLGVDLTSEGIEHGEDWVHIRGAVIQRVFAHDVYHCSELNETLGIAGLPKIDLWG